VGRAADGTSTEGNVPLAVAGIVPVKVTGEGGPILPGESLTSSSTPGHAMKAAKIRAGGIALFPSGVVIGKARRRWSRTSTRRLRRARRSRLLRRARGPRERSSRQR
jgi:hypothetical protein